MRWLGTPYAFERTRKDPKELRFLPEVQAILLGIDRGGFEEAVIRMLILLAELRGSVRRDRLERSSKVLTRDEPFASLGVERRAALIREQSIIAEFEPDRAIETLPNLLPGSEERRKAIEVVEYIAGSMEEMEPRTLKILQRFHAALEPASDYLDLGDRRSAPGKPSGRTCRGGVVTVSASRVCRARAVASLGNRTSKSEKLPSQT